MVICRMPEHAPKKNEETVFFLLISQVREEGEEEEGEEHIYCTYFTILCVFFWMGCTHARFALKIYIHNSIESIKNCIKSGSQ